MNYSQKCRSKYSIEKKQYINQYYCRTWRSWITRHIGISRGEDKKQNRNNNITFEYVDHLLKSSNYKCVMSNVELTHDKTLFSMSIDRIDNSLGHVEGNIQLINRGLNLAKNRHTNEDLIGFLDELINPSKICYDELRDYISSMIRNHRQRDLSKKLICNIDTDYILKLFDENKGCCHYSGIPLMCKSHPYASISIDRIDNSLGHQKGNVAIVSKAINRAKRDYSIDHFVKWLDEIKKSYIKKVLK